MEHDIGQYYREAVADIKSSGIDIAKDIQVYVYKKDCNWWGRTIDYGNYFTIQLNPTLLKTSKKHIMNTLVHEMLHTAIGCYNHGRVWKHYASIMNAKGYNINRCTSAAEMGLVEEKIESSLYRYAVKCEKCGVVLYRNRLCGLINNPEAYRHSTCGGTFHRVEIKVHS